MPSPSGYDLAQLKNTQQPVYLGKLFKILTFLSVWTVFK